MKFNYGEKMKNILFLIFIIFITGCASTNSANMRVGTDQSYTSLKDQREAVLAIKEYSSIPDGATNIITVDASRCHRNSSQIAPSEQDILIDLKIAAYAKGSDGIANIKYSKTSALLQNCWSIITGNATAFTIKN